MLNSFIIFFASKLSFLVVVQPITRNDDDRLNKRSIWFLPVFASAKWPVLPSNLNPLRVAMAACRIAVGVVKMG